MVSANNLALVVSPTSRQNQNEQQSQQEESKIKPMFSRYIVLVLFCINSANKAMQWIELSSVTSKLTYFYGVDNFVINTTSIVFMIAFVLLSWPSCYLIDRIGLRNAVLFGSFGTAAGSLIKCFSCNEKGIYLLFLGQITVAISEQFIFSVPSRLVSVWFPDNEVSRAIGITVLGSEIGIALGFAIPQFVLNGRETKEEIGLGLYWIFLVTTIVSVMAFILDLVLFDEKPKYAPGSARLKQIAIEKETNQMKQGFIGELSLLGNQAKCICKNKNYVLLAISFGISVGLSYTIGTLLNQMLAPLWPGNDILIGNTGFLIIVCGAFSSTLWGQLLDKSHRYLAVNVFLNLATIVSLFLFGYTISFMHEEWAIYLAALALGFFQTGFIVAGLEMAVELTYPAPELVTSSVLNAVPQIMGTIFIFIGSHLVDNYGAIAISGFYIICMLFSLILLLNIKETLKRQEAVAQAESLKANQLPAVILH